MKRGWYVLPIVLMIAMLGIAPLLGTQSVIAQDASPAAGACVAPELPPGTPTPPDATPVAEEPMAVEAEAAPVTEGPASRNLAAEANAALTNVHNCVAEENFTGVAALSTPALWVWASESENPYDFAAGLEGSSPFDVRLTGDTVLDSTGRLGVHIVYGGFFNSPGTLSSERWYFTRDADLWKLDEIKPAVAPDDIIEGVTIITVQMVDYAFALSANTIPAGPVILRFTNTSYSGQVHEGAIVTVAEGTTTESLILQEGLDDSLLTGFAGQIFLEPGQTGDVIFENLAAGTYTIACGIPTADGVSHNHLGMVAQVTVE